MAAALALSSAVPPLVLGATAASADDYDNALNGRYDCVRNPDSKYCDQNQDWRDRENRNDGWYNRDRTDDWRDRSIRRDRLRLSSGTFIPTHTRRQGRIVLQRGEEYSFQLITDRDLRSERDNRVVIPRGSTIEGTLVPYRSGYRFESEFVTLRDGERESLWAVSDILETRDRYSRSDDTPSLSPAASAILETILGRRVSSESNDRWDTIFDRDSRARRDLVVIYPNRDLDLKLNRDFVLSYRDR